MNQLLKGTFNKFGWWHQGTIDATVATADSVLSESERKFQSIKDLSNIVWYQMSSGISALDVRFSMLVNNQTADVDIYEGSIDRPIEKDPDQNCELQRIGTLDIIAGQQIGVILDDLFADEINVSNDITFGGIGRKMPGADHIAAINWDVKAANLIVFHGHTLVDGDCKIWLRGGP